MAAFVSLLLASPALADKSQSQPVKGELPSVSEEFVYETTIEQFDIAEQKKSEVLVSPFRIAPVKFEEVENLASVTGFNPIHFPSTDLSKIVREWKVVGEQYLRKDSHLESEIVRILKEHQELEILRKVNDEWYEVEIKESVQVKYEGKLKKETNKVVGFISSESIQLLDEEDKRTIEYIVEKETRMIQAELKSEIEKELIEEQNRLAEEQLRAKNEARIKAEQAAKIKADKLAKEKQPTKEVTQQQKVAKKSIPQASGSKNVLVNGSKYIGSGYLLGASTSRTDIFDCSSFTLRVFAEAGIQLPRTSAAQAALGVTVSKENLQPGDLVYFNTSGSGISHVGIYAGNGKFLGAQSSTGVAYADMNNSYWGPRYLTAKRIR